MSTFKQTLFCLTFPCMFLHLLVNCLNWFQFLLVKYKEIAVAHDLFMTLLLSKV